MNEVLNKNMKVRTVRKHDVKYQSLGLYELTNLKLLDLDRFHLHEVNLIQRLIEDLPAILDETRPIKVSD